MKDTLVLMAFATLLNERGRGKVDNSYSDAWYSGGGGGAIIFPYYGLSCCLQQIDCM